MSEQLNAAIERLKQINAGMAFDKVYGGSSDDYGHDYSEDISNVIGHYFEELSRRDAAQAARQQPITPKWCLDNGARFSAEWYWFDEGVSIRPIAGGTWLVAVSGQMLNWSAECVGQVEDLRKALRGVCDERK